MEPLRQTNNKFAVTGNDPDLDHEINIKNKQRSDKQNNLKSGLCGKSDTTPSLAALNNYQT